MRVLVLGGTGATGRRTAVELARNQEVTDLVIGGRDHEALHRFTSRLGDRARAAVIDVRRSDEVRKACGGVDVVVNCTGPAHVTELAAATGAVEAGVAYVSLCNDYETVVAAGELDGRARAGGSVAVVGCGLSPGITTMLATLAHDGLDTVEETKISLALSYGDLPTPAHTAHLRHAVASPIGSIGDHRLSFEHSGGSPHLVYFPEPVGWVETVGWPHPEVHNFAGGAPHTLKVQLGLTERAAMDALRASSTVSLASAAVGRRVLGLARSLPPRGPRWSAARIDVVGLRQDRPATVSLGVVDHLINLATTPLALAALQLGRGSQHSGVLSAAEAFDARDFLEALGGRGTRVARLEAVPL